MGWGVGETSLAHWGDGFLISSEYTRVEEHIGGGATDWFLFKYGVGNSYTGAWRGIVYCFSPCEGTTRLQPAPRLEWWILVPLKARVASHVVHFSGCV